MRTGQASRSFLSPPAPVDDLRKFSAHTGFPLRVVDPDEPCPVLFRDLGLVGMNLFLNNRLERLAGPLSPITYMRTANYQEPYEDFEAIGRLVLLRPMALQPWHSGIASVYVARAGRMPSCDTMGLIPGNVDLASVAGSLAAVTTIDELRECFGLRVYHDALAETRALVQALLREMCEVEQHAEPLRKCLKSFDRGKVEWARAVMAAHSITQADLCCAWNHVSRERRASLADALRSIGGDNAFPCIAQH
jgi:hypothetical protein